MKTYLKFPFAGEPLNRLLSAFKDKFIGNRTSLRRSARDKIVKSYRPRDYISNGENVVTFLEFIKYYSHYRMRDNHRRQYEKTCHPCLVNYDFIGKLELLAEDGLSLLKMAGIRDRVAFPPIHQHTRGDEVLKYYSKVPPDDTKQIGELYFSNFAMFGYEFLGPVKSNVKNSWFLEISLAETTKAILMPRGAISIMAYTGMVRQKGVPFSGFRWKGTDFTSWSMLKGRENGKSVILVVRRPKKATRCILWLWKSRDLVYVERRNNLTSQQKISGIIRHSQVSMKAIYV